LKKEKSKKYRFIQILRILSQILFFVLFVTLLFGTHFPGKDYIGNVEIFFHFDPLLALTTLIASRVLFASFIFAAVTIIVTFVFGRFACGWVCPLGSIHQFFSFLFKKSKLLRPQKIKKVISLSLKYYLLIIILVGAVFSLNLAGIMDPLSLLYRSFAVGVFPVLNHTFSNILDLLYQAELYSVADPLAQFLTTLDINPLFTQVFFIGLLFLVPVILNIFRERYWCRYLCPLGALLGIFSRQNILKLKIDPKKCIDCNLCSLHCPTQATPFPIGEWRSSECIYCFTCSAICPTNAIQFPIKSTFEKIEKINLSRRKLIFTSLLGAIAAPFFRLSPESKRASERLIRPPGALPEKQFLQKCVKCGECMKVCPTNAIQPALTEAGPEGIWTPMLVPKIGYCEYYCSLCTQVCPTGALKELTVPEKTKVKIGTAWIDRNRCIPWKFGDPCIVCEEHCPVSPKAIKLIKIEVITPEGEIKNPMAPVIDIETCIGCGICENKCPVVDKPAIYVTSVGESRSEDNQLKLDLLSGSRDFY
jgi:MauM/NapG family ferredoxin protein